MTPIRLDILRREVGTGELDPEQVARRTSSETVDFGRPPVPAELIEERWAEIEGVPA